MDELELPEYLENLDEKVLLSLGGTKHEIRKPSALELLDMHEESKKIDKDDTRGLLLYQINTLIKLGLSEPLAKSLNINMLKNTFAAIGSEPAKKK